ncbi:MAG: pantetheine-phosphate adenylyltransferase [Planctomycetota bacterium]|jgi:pantetheine-phosphate adenylyltransferase|nr:pantetheine-phosphate adenylyltransferase [Planctomycetota bacterium]
MNAALYAGSFDPPTLGHLDIVTRAAQASERLVVGVGFNPAKKHFIPVEDRVALIQAECAEAGVENVTVEAFSGATVEFARKHDIHLLVRGLRGFADLERERGLAEINGHNGFETMFLLARSQHAHISSSLVREVIVAGLCLDQLVPARVAAALVRHGAVTSQSQALAGR